MFMLAGDDSSSARQPSKVLDKALTRQASLREHAATEFLHNSAMSL